MRRALLAAVSLQLLVLAACSTRQAPRGFARVVASADTAAAAIDHITVRILDGSGAELLEHPLYFASGAWQATLSDLPVGSYTFQADVYSSSDDSQLTFTGQASPVVIVANQTAVVEIVVHATGGPISVVEPAITAVTASTGTPQEGQAVTLSADATGSGTLDFTWSANGGAFGDAQSGARTADGATVTWYAPSTPGPQSLTITVSDTAGNQASLDFSLTVIAGEGAATVNVFLPPQILSLDAAQDGNGGWDLALEVATPPDGDALAFAWSKDPECPEGSGFDDETAQDPVFTVGGPGSCTLTVLVTDPVAGLTVAPGATARITISSSAATAAYGPTITLGAQSALSASAGQTVQFEISALDGNQPPEALTYAWTASEGSPTSGSGAAFGWTAGDCVSSAGATITATVTNQGGLGATQGFTVSPADGASCVPHLVQLAAAANHALVLMSDGSFYGWGSDGSGELGDGQSGLNQPFPVFVDSGIKLVWLGASGGQTGERSFGLTADGTLYGWGNNSFGLLGDGTATTHKTPTLISCCWLSIGANEDHTLGVKLDGSLWSWGKNTFGQLGDGTTTDHFAPEQIAPGGFAAVASGARFHSAALGSDGTVYAWGYNAYGQVGDGSTTNRKQPFALGGGFSAITAGRYTVLAIRQADGSIYGSGLNSGANLGNGSRGNQLAFGPVATGLTGITQVFAGDSDGYALGGGTIYAWGTNDDGELGTGDQNTRTTPVAIGSGYQLVAAGWIFGVAAKNGGVYTWGWNGNEQLGNGGSPSRALAPTLINLTP